jgi:hypothetical protein
VFKQGRSNTISGRRRAVTSRAGRPRLGVRAHPRAFPTHHVFQCPHPEAPCAPRSSTSRARSAGPPRAPLRARRSRPLLYGALGARYFASRRIEGPFFPRLQSRPQRLPARAARRSPRPAWSSAVRAPVSPALRRYTFSRPPAC